MKYALIGFGGLILLLIIIGSIFAGSYNGLVSLQSDVQEKRAQIETDLQRRFDLVPGLVNSVRGAMKQEQTVFKAIADARTHYAGTQPNSPERIEASQQYEGALSRLLVVMENYPQLKSIETVNNLMVQLEGTENRIRFSRAKYNESVRVYNQTRRSFPTNIFAAIFGFKEEPFFQSVQEAKVAPKVDLE